MQNEVVGVFFSVILYHTIQTLCNARIFSDFVAMALTKISFGVYYQVRRFSFTVNERFDINTATINRIDRIEWNRKVSVKHYYT